MLFKSNLKIEIKPIFYPLKSIKKGAVHQIMMIAAPIGTFERELKRKKLSRNTTSSQHYELQY